MKSDELENLFREKVREVEQEALPKSQWDKDAVFLRVQHRLRREQVNSWKLFLRVAAVFLIGLLSWTLLYKFELTDRAASEISDKVSHDKPQPLKQAPSDQLLSIRIGADSIQEAQLLAQASDMFKRPKERMAARQLRQSEAKDATDMERPQGIIIAPATGTGMDTAAVAIAQLPEKAPEKVEITVVLGGNTLARIAKEDSSKTVAVENKEKQLDLNRDTEGAETLPIAIVRVKNPLSLNKEILP